MLDGVCECVYLPRTRSVSSTKLKREISQADLRIQDNPQGERPLLPTTTKNPPVSPTSANPLPADFHFDACPS